MIGDCGDGDAILAIKGLGPSVELSAVLDGGIEIGGSLRQAEGE